jgi:hypothetical protein
MYPRAVLSGFGFISLVAVLVLLTGCGAAETPAGSSPDDVVSNTPGADPPEPGGPQRVEPHEDVVDVRATHWDKHKVRDGGRAIDLFFWSGVEECYGVDRVEIVYGKKLIRATIYEGREPSAETCIELAVRKVIRVELEEPLGDRRVVDGNRQD